MIPPAVGLQALQIRAGNVGPGVEYQAEVRGSIAEGHCRLGLAGGVQVGDGPLPEL